MVEPAFKQHHKERWDKLARNIKALNPRAETQRAPVCQKRDPRKISREG